MRFRSTPADVRYTADAKAWCGVALGLTDARDLIKEGITTKHGADAAMDHYFHQISQVGDTESEHERASSQGDWSPKHEKSGERRRA